MTTDIFRSIVAMAALTVLLGVGYPLVVTGVAQLAMPDRAHGSLVRRDGTVVGSRLVAQAFDRPVLDDAGRQVVDDAGSEQRAPDPAWFQPRPSQTQFNASGSSFLNLGANQRELADLYADRLKAYLSFERSAAPELEPADVPIDALTNSGSGIDPHISPANARIQAHRVARERHVPLRAVLRLVERHSSGRAFGVFGEPAVNVLELNLDLDEEYPAR